MHLGQNLAREAGVLFFSAGHAGVEITGERIGFVREDLHLGHVGGKKREMIIDEDPKPLDGISRVRQTLLESFKNATKAVVLNQKKKLFFRLAVVIKAGKTDSCLTRDVTH